MKKFGIFNPLQQNFHWQCVLDGTINPTEFVVPAQDTLYVDNEKLADFLKKHLADEIINKRGIKTNYEDEQKKILEEITINL